MLLLCERLNEPLAAQMQLELPFEQRSRSRFRAVCNTGEEVGVVLRRGQVLRGGDLLRANDGRVVQIVAAAESVSTVRCADAQRLARAAYHLGNRHVALEIGAAWLRYRHDHVLDDMLRGFGLDVSVGQASFEPEGGAYDVGESHHHAGDDHSHE